jgi:hypothetical protein
MKNIIENKKIDFPPELQTLYKTCEQNALSFLDQKNYVAAEREYRTLLSAFFEAQGNKIRYHKGGIYHQIGYCLFLQKKTEDALLYFEAAFIEDCVSEYEATRLPAFFNLHNVYRISAAQLFKLVSKIKSDIVGNIPLNPEIYLTNYIDSGNKLESTKVNKAKNVFVGGNYKNIALLRYIEDKVYDVGFSPILAINFEVKKEDIYTHAMALLQDCGSAIFEITFDAGHLMEIERAINTNLFSKENMLLLFQKRDDITEHYITKMLLGVQVKPIGYMKIEELSEKVKAFLNEIKQ